MSIENFMGMFKKNNSEEGSGEKLNKGKEAITNLFNTTEINNRLNKANQQV